MLKVNFINQKEKMNTISQILLFGSVFLLMTCLDQSASKSKNKLSAEVTKDSEMADMIAEENVSIEYNFKQFTIQEENYTGQLVVIATNVRLRSNPSISSNENILAKANRGDVFKVISKTQKKQNIGDFGINPWYQINLESGNAWIFGGLTSLAEDGKYAEKEYDGASIGQEEENPPILELSENGINWLVKLYAVSYMNPDALHIVIDEIPSRKLPEIIFTLQKIIINLQKGGLTESQMASDAYQVNQKARANMMEYGVNPGNHGPTIELPISMTWWWANDMQNVLRDQSNWENTLSYQHISINLAQFRIPDLNLDLFSSGSSPLDAYFDNYKKQIIEMALKQAAEQYIKKIERNYNNYILPSLN